VPSKKHQNPSKYQNTKNIPSDCRPLLPLPPPPTIPVVGLSLSKYQSMKIYEAHCQCSSIVLGIGSVHCFTTKRRLHARTLSLPQLCWRRWGLSYRPSLVHPNGLYRGESVCVCVCGAMPLSEPLIVFCVCFDCKMSHWILTVSAPIGRKYWCTELSVITFWRLEHALLALGFCGHFVHILLCSKVERVGSLWGDEWVLCLRSVCIPRPAVCAPSMRLVCV